MTEIQPSWEQDVLNQSLGNNSAMLGDLKRGWRVLGERERESREVLVGEKGEKYRFR